MPRIRLVPDASPLGDEGAALLREEAERRERQTAWTHARDAKLASIRQRRTELLVDESAARGDRMAARAWNWITGKGAVRATPSSIGVLSRYVARASNTAAVALDQFREGGLPTEAPPPMSPLAASAGRALTLHVTMMAVAQLIISDGGAMTNAPLRDQPSRGNGSKELTAAGGLRIVTPAQDEADWAKLLGIPAVGKARTVRTHEPLRRLQTLRFVKYPENRPSKFTLLSEDGTGRPWTRPELDPLEPYFNIPFDFWRNRWYLWLTPAEIATLFAIYHAWSVAPGKAGVEGLGLPESVRRSVYDMSGERYSAIHELIEFGLLEMVTPSLRPRRAATTSQKVQPGLTHHVRPVVDGLAREARATVLGCLSESPLPPRLTLLPVTRSVYAAALRKEEITPMANPAP